MAKRGPSGIWDRPRAKREIEFVLRDVGAQLRAMRKALGMSQVMAADVAGLSAHAVLQIEHGRSRVTLPSVVALALVYGVKLKINFEPVSKIER